MNTVKYVCYTVQVVQQLNLVVDICELPLHINTKATTQVVRALHMGPQEMPLDLKCNLADYEDLDAS